MSFPKGLIVTSPLLSNVGWGLSRRKMLTQTR